ncbi:MAG: S1 RNA-binding domain-containing protein [Terracidiphilus sp.]
MTNEINQDSLPTPEETPQPAAAPAAEPTPAAAPAEATAPETTAGAEAPLASEADTARLKSCPDTGQSLPEDAIVATAENAPGSVAEAAEPVAEAAAPASVAEQTPAPAPKAAPAEAKPAAPAIEEPEEPQESFADLLKDFERSHSHRGEPGQRQLKGVVVSITAEQVFLDIGYKTEGVLPRSAFAHNGDAVKVGDTFPVSVTGRNEEHYYELSLFKVRQVHDWSALEAAFAEKTAVVGTVTEVIKGGLSVDIGVRAFMPGSRSGARDAAEMEKLVGTEINCRITKLDVTDENVVVDRRIVLEEQARGVTAARREALKEGDTVTGTVRTLMPYGAFIDLGGIDGLLHVSDISHTRIAKPEDALSVGQELELRILKIDPETKKISLGLKQLQAEPWLTAPDRLTVGHRITGTVTRIADFGAFIEIEPGVEGLLHISEMSYGRKLRHPSDLLRQGDRVETIILDLSPEKRRVSLGLKQTLADPWSDVLRNFPVGSQIEGPVTKLMNFGAFVQLADGVEGLVHVSEISAEKRINHPQDVLRAGQIVKAQVLAIDTEKRQIKLSMKQLIPSHIDEYIAEHKVGDTVSGRVIEQSISLIHVELGDGIRGTCRTLKSPSALTEAQSAAATQQPLDLSALSSQLKSRWKGHTPAVQVKQEHLSEGQIRSFKITKLNAEAKQIEVELA